MRSPTAAFDLRAALSEEVDAAINELNGPLVKAKAIHRCRVRLKRARALARVGRACAPGLSAVFNESARSIMQTLSHGRDLAALAHIARDVAQRARKKEAAALIVAADALDSAQLSMTGPDLGAIRAGLRDLLAMAQVWPEASTRQIARGVERIARRARRARRRGYGAALVTRRHEWRKREKDRLYAATLITAEWPSDRKRRRKQSERLAEVLGRERDTLLLLERLEQDAQLAGGKSSTARAIVAVDRARVRLGRRADHLGAKLHAGGA